MDYNEIFRNKTKQLALEIIETFSPIPLSDTVSVIRRQILRSSTSAAANYRAVGRARSEKERYAKLSIVIEEADETLFWLEIVETLQWLPTEKLTDLKLKTEEILKATATYRKKLSMKQ